MRRRRLWWWPPRRKMKQWERYRGQLSTTAASVPVCAARPSEPLRRYPGRPGSCRRVVPAMSRDVSRRRDGERAERYRRAGHRGGPVSASRSASNGAGVVGASGNIGVVARHRWRSCRLFLGNLHVQGTLSKSAGLPDRPSAGPGEPFLQHSFVESPDMKNVYDGVATTDRAACHRAAARLFEALNRSFRYQLTIVGRCSRRRSSGRNRRQPVHDQRRASARRRCPGR